MPSRATVLWVGQPPSASLAHEFTSRKLFVQTVGMEQCADLWKTAAAAVIWNPTDADIELLAQGGLKDALAHGLFVRIVAPLEEIGRHRAGLAEVPALGTRWLLVAGSQCDLAEDIARHDPGPAYDVNVKLISGKHEFSEEETVLLRRAFADCTEVELLRMSDGTAAVFTAHAKLKDSRVGPYPLPMFVKIDKRERTEQEQRFYGECTTQFIPFHARPNLHLSKCLSGMERGVLVGDFVERSESLLSVVERGVAQSAIDSLFQDALRGWRAQPYWGHQTAVKLKLFDQCLGPELKDSKRTRLVEYSKSAAELGASLDAFEVAGKLDALPAIEHRRGWTHGDLHCANVRVRAGEAILIDFHSVRGSPLSTDPATLEVSLALEAHGDEIAWQQAMTELYSLDNLRTVPRPREPGATFHALWEAVRQIRRYGVPEQVDDQEYSRAVAIQLLRKAMHKRNSGEQLSRRPFLIKLAAGIVLALEARPGDE
jgi:hypothetical protein